MSYPDKKILETLTGCRVSVFDKISSTNDAAKAAAKAGICADSLFIARMQTGGHGRGEHSFFSYDGGIYLSLLLEKSSGMLPREMITSASAVAVHRALMSFGFETKIKWINDLYYRDKKICGILALALDKAVVIGVGINAESTVFPKELNSKAGALGYCGELDKLVAEVTRELRIAVYETSDTITDYCRKFSYTLGKRVGYEINGICRTGIACAIGDDGSLSVKLDDGGTETLRSGEVSVQSL